MSDRGVGRLVVILILILSSAFIGFTTGFDSGYHSATSELFSSGKSCNCPPAVKP